MVVLSTGSSRSRHHAPKSVASTTLQKRLVAAITSAQCGEIRTVRLFRRNPRADVKSGGPQRTPQ
jgi:hypothetical protein